MANLVGEDVPTGPTTLRCRRCHRGVAPGEPYRRWTYRGHWRDGPLTVVEVEHLRCPVTRPSPEEANNG